MSSNIPELDSGNSLFVNEDYDGAIVAYSRGLEKEPTHSDLLTRRSAAYLKIKNFSAALADATAAIQADPSQAHAYLRQAIAAFSLENYKLAFEALTRGTQLLTSDSSLASSFKQWLDKTTAELDRLGLALPSSQPTPSQDSSSPSPSSSSSSSSSTSSSSEIPSSQPKSPIEIVPPTTYRQEWYQSPSHLTVEIFVRDTTAEQCSIQVRPRSLALVVKFANKNSEFHKSIELLDDVLPDATRTTHLKSKIEIRLQKARVAHWKTLEPAADGLTVTDWFAGDINAPPQTHYPTSAPVKKDWSKIAAEIEEDQPTGDAALNKVFQDIFKNGSDEQRRAMVKSFTESGGTVLSTNWQDVGSRKVEVTPPKGLEAKKWE